MQIRVWENEMGVWRKCSFIHYSNDENVYPYQAKERKTHTLIKNGCQSKRIMQCTVDFPMGCSGFFWLFFTNVNQKYNVILTMNSQKTTYTMSQKTSVHPRAFAGLNSCSSLFSSGELKQFVMFVNKCDGPRSLLNTRISKNTQNKNPPKK